MTGGDGSRVSSLVIPAKAGIQSEWIPHQVRDDGRGWIPNPKRFIPYRK